MRTIRSFRRGMTLLEVVLAVTILAAMSGLIASLWTQSERMSRDAMSGRRELRLARVIEMLRSQWADRRTSVRLGVAGESVSVEKETLTYISATPILEPGWPLVRVRLIVERDDQALGPLEAWRLVYEELPVVDLKSVQATPEARSPVGDGRPLGAPPLRRMTLLNACTRLEWQRFGRSDALEAADQPRDAESTEKPAPERPEIINADDKVRAWRTITEEFTGRTEAVRLAGTIEEEEFSCVFVIGDSR